MGKALVTRPDEVARALEQAPLLLGAAAMLTLPARVGAGAVLAIRR